MFLTTNILCSGGVLVSCVYARLSVGVFNVNIINAWVYVYVYVIGPFDIFLGPYLCFEQLTTFDLYTVYQWDIN